MKSAGNDIVALKAINIERTNLPAFYSKIITHAEHDLYRQPQFAAMPFHVFVWLLWSVKESAFKYLQRSDPALIFSPTKIAVTSLCLPAAQPATDIADAEWQNGQANGSFHSGEVIFQAYRLYFRSKVTNGFIATVVHEATDFEGVYWGVKTIHQPDQASQSNQVRDFALQRLRAVLHYDNLQIAKTPQGIPIILHHHAATDIPISLAHHECFVSYALYLPQ